MAIFITVFHAALTATALLIPLVLLYRARQGPRPPPIFRQTSRIILVSMSGIVSMIGSAFFPPLFFVAIFIGLAGFIWISLAPQHPADD